MVQNLHCPNHPANNPRVAVAPTAFHESTSKSKYMLIVSCFIHWSLKTKRAGYQVVSRASFDWRYILNYFCCSRDVALKRHSPPNASHRCPPNSPHSQDPVHEAVHVLLVPWRRVSISHTHVRQPQQQQCCLLGWSGLACSQIRRPGEPHHCMSTCVCASTVTNRTCITTLIFSMGKL